MRILVTQVTRMGDMIQTTPLIRALRQQHPDARISAMVRPMGKTVAEHNPDIDEVFVYDEDGMFQNLCAHDSDRLLAAYNNADAVISWLRDSRFDVAYNTTHSYASALLLRIAGIPEVVGAHLSEDGQFVLRGPWTAYFFSSVFNRAFNDFNLCDIIARFARDAPPSRQLLFETTEDEEQFAERLIQETSEGNDGPIVCMQLGASEEGKRWPPECFADVALSAHQNLGAQIFLLGVTGEAALGERFEARAPGIAEHLFGRTSLGQVAALLKRASALVTNDTGTMHLAAAVNCPVVLISVGHVHFRETGPYGTGHWALEARDGARGLSLVGKGGGEIIEAKHVYMLLERVLADPGPERGLSVSDDGEWNEVDVYRSDFAADGCLEWYPMMARPMTEHDYIRQAYRYMWLEHTGGCRDGELLDEAARSFFARYSESYLGYVNDALTSRFNELAAIAGRGIKLTRELLETLTDSRDLDRAEAIASELKGLDEEVRIHGEVHQGCRPLTFLTRFERDALEGIDPISLAQETLRIYELLHERAQSMTRQLSRLGNL